MRVTIPLSDRNSDALRALAWRELRNPRYQAVRLIEEGLRQRGLLEESEERDREPAAAGADDAHENYVKLMQDVADERNAHAAQVAELAGGRPHRPNALDALEYFRQRLVDALGEHGPQGGRYSTLELIWAVERLVSRVSAANVRAVNAEAQVEAIRKALGVLGATMGCQCLTEIGPGEPHDSLFCVTINALAWDGPDDATP